jgi:hypothetical protein
MKAGVDEVYGLLLQAIYGKQSFVFRKWKENLVMIRKYEDEFMCLEDFNSLKINIKDMTQ